MKSICACVGALSGVLPISQSSRQLELAAEDADGGTGFCASLDIALLGAALLMLVSAAAAAPDAATHGTVFIIIC